MFMVDHQLCHRRNLELPHMAALETGTYFLIKKKRELESKVKN